MQPESYILYSSGLEHKSASEDETIQKIVEAMSNVQHKTEAKHGHAMRTVHTKSHGILKGSLHVYEGLPYFLRQGVFANEATYDVMLRFSTSPGDLAADSIGGVRGVGLKLIGVPGERMLTDAAQATTQDFLFVNHPTFPAKDAKAFSVQAQLLDKVVSNLPEGVQIAQNTAARGAGEVARHLGFDPIGLAVGIAKKETNILGDTFYTGVPIRYGDYVCKLSLAPLSTNVQELADASIDLKDHDALRHLVIDFFDRQSAEYELRVQLCTNLNTMPIEDPSIKWPEEESPYIGVARISFPRQNVWGEARKQYGEDVLTFNPWQCVVAHQPLGSIMRTRQAVYEASSRYRHSKTGAPKIEPTSAADMPD